MSKLALKWNVELRTVALVRRRRGLLAHDLPHMTMLVSRWAGPSRCNIVQTRLFFPLSRISALAAGSVSHSHPSERRTR